MSLEFKPVLLAHSKDEAGALVFERDRLVAVLAQLSDEHGARAGRWFLECGFGPLTGQYPDFKNIDEAKSWIEEILQRRTH